MKLNINNQILEVEVCDTFSKRLLGFMFVKQKITVGKCFFNCRSIHTFFMFQKIDVVVCNRDQTILKVICNFPRNRVLFPIKNATTIYELPLNTGKHLKEQQKMPIEKEFVI